MEHPTSPTYWDERQAHQQQLQQHPLKDDSLHLPAGPGSGSGPPERIPEDQSIFHYCEGNLNFSTAHSEDDEYFQKKKFSRVAVECSTE